MCLILVILVRLILVRTKPQYILFKNHLVLEISYFQLCHVYVKICLRIGQQIKTKKFTKNLMCKDREISYPCYLHFDCMIWLTVYWPTKSN